MSKDNDSDWSIVNEHSDDERDKDKDKDNTRNKVVPEDTSQKESEKTEEPYFDFLFDFPCSLNLPRPSMPSIDFTMFMTPCMLNFYLWVKGLLNNKTKTKTKTTEMTLDEEMSSYLSSIKLGFKFRRSLGRSVKSVKNIDTHQFKVSVDLSSLLGEVYDQGSLGSCTSQAIAAAFDYYKNTHLKASTEDFLASRLFIYYNERLLENTINWDSGATIEDGMKSLGVYGVCPEKDFPYNTLNYRTKPSALAYSDGIPNKCTDVIPVDISVESFKYYLDKSCPVVFGFEVYQSFMTLDTAKSGIMPIPNEHEKLLGGHAVVAVGYDSEKTYQTSTGLLKGFFLVRNSWSKSWGQNGHYWMPYDYVVNKSTSLGDAWVISHEQ